MSSDDPFSDPFSDPAISEALNQQQHTYVSVDDTSALSAAAVGGAATTSTASAGIGASSTFASPAEELRAKEAELARREAELSRREEGLREQENAMRQHGFRVPNWPPFYPLIYHNIEEEIPEVSRGVMKRIYFFWLATLGLLGWNLIACLALLISRTTTNSANDFGVSLIYYIFLLFEGCHILFAAYMAVGFSGSGSGGLINFLAALSNGSYFTAVLCVLDLAGFVADGVFAFWLWVEVQRHTKQGGHSLNTARAQAMQMGVLGST
ncbi:hypothetical protein HK405_011796 [Cladochytrium tenue]|nr:hypothetical protein HK405_011796 [Cladochytrium tenue]